MPDKKDDDKAKAKDAAKPARIPDNPTGDKFGEFDDKGVKYLVTTNITGHTPGAVITLRELGAGAQVQRLVDAGAIVEIPEEQAEAADAAEAKAEEQRVDPAYSTGGHEIASKTKEIGEAGEPDPKMGNPEAEAPYVPMNENLPGVEVEESHSPKAAGATQSEGKHGRKGR